MAAVEIYQAQGESTGQQAQSQQQQATAGIPGKDDERKLFVGGLSRNTTDKELRDHFGKFGEIESISVKIDPYTGLSRGFAFMVFTNPKTIDKLLASGEHYINKRKVSNSILFSSIASILGLCIYTFFTCVDIFTGILISIIIILLACASRRVCTWLARGGSGGGTTRAKSLSSGLKISNNIFINPMIYSSSIQRSKDSIYQA